MFSLLLSTFRRLAYLGVFSLVVATLFVDDEEDEAAKEEGKEAERQTTSEASEEDTIFIPLGFAYQLPQKFYKGTDPEWQSFVQMSHNKKLCDFLKSE